MNLHAIAAPLVGVINGNVVGDIRVNQGYVTDAAGRRTPNYTNMPGVRMQVQALSGPELAQLDGLNIQGVKRGVYLFGDIQGAVRPEAKGGDVLVFSNRVWLVVTVLETWGEAQWCKVVVVLQEGPPPPFNPGETEWTEVDW